MSDKMREEFATWYLAEVTQSYGEGVRAQAQKNLDWTREDGSFADPMLRLACLAWQASRAAVVVELPKEVDQFADDDPGRRAFSLHTNTAIRSCRAAIEAAGLKVAP